MIVLQRRVRHNIDSLPCFHIREIDSSSKKNILNDSLSSIHLAFFHPVKTGLNEIEPPTPPSHPRQTGRSESQRHIPRPIRKGIRASRKHVVILLLLLLLLIWHIHRLSRRVTADIHRGP